MKKSLKSVLSVLTIFFSKIYSQKLHLLLKGYRDEVYSIWIRQFLPGKPHGLIRCGVQIEGAENVYIGDGIQIGRNTLIEAIIGRKGQASQPSITIGKNCGIGYENHISAMGKIIIGDGLLTGRHVLVSDNNHGKFAKEDLTIRPQDRDVTSKGGITIGNNVWIGENACVLGGVTIGDGAIIAANAVVVNDIQAYCLAAGVPAKILKNL